MEGRVADEKGKEGEIWAMSFTPIETIEYKNKKRKNQKSFLRENA